MSRIAAAILLLLTFPVVLFFALAIKFNYPGPIFYRQVREGKNGKPFKIIKLRTMVMNAEAVLKNMLRDNPLLAKHWEEKGMLTNDPRIAGKIGRLARELSIDELPQLWNVVRGEMAFVGPRPLELFSFDILHPDTRKRRYSVLPGITGLAQVENRGASIRQMQFYDAIFIRNQGVCIRAYVLYRTVFSILRRTGA